MPWYRIGGTMMHMRMDKRQAKKWPPPCPFFVYIRHTEDGVVTERRLARCMCPAPYLCDWLGCNVPICEQHRQQLVPGFDFCPFTTRRAACFPGCCPHPSERTYDHPRRSNHARSIPRRRKRHRRRLQRLPRARARAL